MIILNPSDRLSSLDKLENGLEQILKNRKDENRCLFICYIIFFLNEHVP